MRPAEPKAQAPKPPAAVMRGAANALERLRAQAGKRLARLREPETPR